MNDQTIRKINTITTGDFVEFEYFRNGQWLPARISGTALRLMSGPGSLKQDAVIIPENQERIWRAACEQPVEEGKRLMLTSDHF